MSTWPGRGWSRASETASATTADVIFGIFWREDFAAQSRIRRRISRSQRGLDALGNGAAPCLGVLEKVTHDMLGLVRAVADLKDEYGLRFIHQVHDESGVAQHFQRFGEACD